MNVVVELDAGRVLIERQMVQLWMDANLCAFDTYYVP